MGERKKKKVPDKSVIFSPEFNPEDEDMDKNLEESSILDEYQQESLEVEKIPEESTEKKKTFEEPEEVHVNNEKILLYNSQKILSNKINNVTKGPIMLRLKIFEDERFKIILKNPYDAVTAHIEGNYVKDQEYRKFKLPVRLIKGIWNLNVHIFSAKDRELIEYRLNME
jgi:hypothetical protein